MPHKFNLTNNSIKAIEHLTPKLKNSIYTSKIIEWLENFEEDEVKDMTGLLSLFEYIPFNEFMYRMDFLLKRILNNVDEGDKILIYPYGKVGKSGTLVTYPLRNTHTFKEMDNMGLIEITHDFQKITKKDNIKHVVFLDDYIGSGTTFIYEYENKEIQSWLNNLGNPSVFLLASVTMQKAFEKIMNIHPSVKIISEFRKNYKEVIESANFLLPNGHRIDELVRKYGEHLEGKNNARGYKKTGSLVSFFHGTPNNTLPIFWSANNKWKTLYPRHADVRMNEAKEFKKSMLYYLGLFDKVKFDLMNLRSISNEELDNDILYLEKFNQKYFQEIALIYLAYSKMDIYMICQTLGLTWEELNVIYKRTINWGLFNTGFQLTLKAMAIINKIKSGKRKNSIRKIKKDNFTIKNTLYLPKTFRGYS